MDRFKFRAWHSEHKRMIDVYGLGTDFITENTLDGVDPGTNCWHGDDFEKLIVMQCTGLKDKNGTLIYEGDVVRSSGAGIGEILWCSESSMFRVKWHDKIYHQVRSQSQNYTMNGERMFQNTQLVWRIIGNTHQNSDVLCSSE